MTEISGRTIRRSSNVVSRVVADEAIVVPIRRGVAEMDSIYTFNSTGSMLWAMVEEGRRAVDMTARLQAEYGLTADQAKADVEKFVTELIEAGLVQFQ